VAEEDVPARRRALRDDVARLATDLGLAIRQARSVNLPLAPGVPEAREALVRWANLLGQLLGRGQ
jgi:hypothetical protein